MAGNMMVDVLEQAIPQLDLAEKARLVGALRRSIEDEMGGAEEDGARASSCPRCGCTAVVRDGRGGGSQRWLCNGCGRTFTARTDKLLATTKLPLGKWLAYAELFVERRPLRECAERVGVSLKTSWFMRHRMCEVVERMLPAFEAGAGCEVELDEKYVRGSYTGNHSRNKSGFPFPAARGGAGATGSGAA